MTPFDPSSSTTQILSSMHMDYVHHVAFDVYGRRMATCSGDRFIRIWDLTASGEWKLGGEWQAHKGSISQIQWAHPEFGTLLASCGSDHDAKIWEYDSGRWIEKAKLTEARRAVACCGFAPRHLGLKLATGSSDGSVRIYEAVDVMNLAQWPLQATIAAFPSAALGVSCLSWCTGRFEPPTMVVGGSHLVHVYRYSDAARTWQSLLTLPSGGSAHVLDVAWAPNVGRRHHLIATVDSEKLRVYKLARSNNKIELESQKVLDTSKVWRCQWNVTGTVLASSGDGGVVQLWKSDFEGNWKCVSQVFGDLTPTMTG